MSHFHSLFLKCLLKKVVNGTAPHCTASKSLSFPFTSGWAASLQKNVSLALFYLLNSIQKITALYEIEPFPFSPAWHVIFKEKHGKMYLFFHSNMAVFTNLCKQFPDLSFLEMLLNPGIEFYIIFPKDNVQNVLPKSKEKTNNQSKSILYQLNIKLYYIISVITFEHVTILLLLQRHFKRLSTL